MVSSIICTTSCEAFSRSSALAINEARRSIGLRKSQRLLESNEENDDQRLVGPAADLFADIHLRRLQVLKYMGGVIMAGRE
jgi:hypothetical protein